jgi:site-specific DNA recombinase
MCRTDPEEPDVPKTSPAPITLDGYVRVSQTRGREGDSFISPKVQQETIQRWADGRGVTIAEWHEDLDQSGGALSRPGLDAMLERIRAGHTGGVAVAALDRLSPAGVADALGLVESVHDAGAKVAVVDLGIDPTTPVGEFAVTIFLALGRMQRRQFVQKWDEAQGQAISRGVHFRAPFGYTKPPKKGRDGQPIVPNPATAPLVGRAFELRAAGESWPRIAEYLNKHHAPNKAKAWTHATVTHLIRNRAYLGEAYHGDHVQPGAHPALVSVDLWEAANAVHGRSPSRRIRGADGELTNGGDGALLTGIVRCAGCRRTMTPSETRGGGRTDRLLTYRCRRRHGAGECEAACAIKREVIEDHVQRAFLARYADVSIEGVADCADLEAAQLEVREAEADLVAYRDNERVRDALAVLDDGSFEDGITVRAARVISARERLSAARTSAVGFDIPDADTYGALTTSERRRLLRAGIGAVFVRRSATRGGRGGTPDPAERVLVVWPGDEPDDLPGRHSATVQPIVPFGW